MSEIVIISTLALGEGLDRFHIFFKLNYSTIGMLGKIFSPNFIHITHTLADIFDRKSAEGMEELIVLYFMFKVKDSDGI